MSDCRFGVSPVNYPDPDPDIVSANFLTQLTDTRNDNILDMTLTTNPDIISNLQTQPGMRDFTFTFFLPLPGYWYALSFEDYHQLSARRGKKGRMKKMSRNKEG